MNFAEGIVKHTIIVCCQQNSKRSAVVGLLDKHGHRVIPSANLYDSLKAVSNHMPHLVIADARLSDGTAGTLFDRLSKHPVLKHTPILVLVASKTKEQLTPLKGRKFAGFLLGKLEGGTLIAKINEILAANSGTSPYFLRGSDYGLKPGFAIGMPAKIVGQEDENVVCQSSSELDPNATLVCVPKEKNKAPALFKMASNLKREDQIFNIFPLNRIKGKGRAWLTDLPIVGQGGDSEGLSHRVAFFEPNRERFDQFKSILAGYEIELLHAPSLQVAVSLLERDGSSLGAIYLHELRQDASSIQLKKAFSNIKPEMRPPLIVGTSSLNSRSTADIRYIKRPFGLGVLVDMLHAAFKSQSGIVSSAEIASFELDVLFQAPAELLGLDEIGGIFQTKFPIASGTMVTLEHDQLSEVWHGENRVKIERSKLIDNSNWQVRFSLLNTGSKTKYWEKLYEQLEKNKSDLAG